MRLSVKKRSNITLLYSLQLGSVTCIATVASEPDCNALKIATSSFSDPANPTYTGIALLLHVLIYSDWKYS